MSGDEDLEKFLNGGDDDDIDGEEVPYCQKQLLFNTIKQRMDHIRDLLVIFSKLQLKDSKHSDKIESLYKESQEASLQLDYMLALLMDEININNDENEKGGIDDTI